MWWFGVDEKVADAFAYIIQSVLGLLIAIPAGILAAVGRGFDEIVYYTITNFHYTFSTFFASGVETAWGGFRDIANIVMIAMFVFVSIMVILNIPKYGLKQFGVRILIVALLINFSLFFTKAIVDISNVTALQFRKAIQVKTATGEDAGIADIFMQQAGLTEGWLVGGRDALNEIIKADGNKHDYSGAFVYTIVTMIFFSALTAVLLYGLILMVTRMVVLLVLMFTSAAAFTAYMIPGGNSWWDKWWDALIKNALFAPLFMLMLWGVVNIMQEMPRSGGGSNFANLVTKEGGSWLYILNMMIVIGLLYASTKIADSLSIKGAGFARKVGMKGFAGSLRLSGFGGALGGAGWIGGRAIGGNAQRLADNATLRQAANSENLITRLAARGALNASKGVAKRSFDLRDSKMFSGGLKKAGVSLGTGVGNYEADIKREAGYTADAARATAEVKKRNEQDNPRDAAQGEQPTKASNEEGSPKVQALAPEVIVEAPATEGKDSSPTASDRAIDGNSAEIGTLAETIKEKQEQEQKQATRDRIDVQSSKDASTRGFSGISVRDNKGRDWAFVESKVGQLPEDKMKNSSQSEYVAQYRKSGASSKRLRDIALGKTSSLKTTRDRIANAAVKELGTSSEEQQIAEFLKKAKKNEEDIGELKNKNKGDK